MRNFRVTGMSCAACSARVETAVSRVDGVDSCSVNLLTGTMTVEGTASSDSIIAAVIAAGYGASVSESGHSVRTDNGGEIRSLLRRLILSAVFLIPLLYISMGHVMLGWYLPPMPPIAVGIAELLLTTAVAVINRRFFSSGIKAIVRLSPNMDSLVSIGAGAAYIYSLTVLMTQTGHSALHSLYFESTAVILTLITVGKLLEAYSKGRTTDALKALARLAPQTASVIRDGAEQTVLLSSVQVGDIFVVRAGDSIPVDGTVIDGTGSVDQSALTGESIPVYKQAGDTVTTGSIDLNGFLKCRAERVGEDTALSKMIRSVSDASASKAPIARIADKVSGVFVPAVIAIAAVTVICWLIFDGSVAQALTRGISVLVISCPCALGLATPVAVMVGNGVAARHGILFKTAAAIENTGRIKTVALDKTGTVTSGAPQVTDTVPMGVDREYLLRTAYSLEIKSEHPLARAIITEAEKHGLLPDDVADHVTAAGNGISAKKGSTVLYGGNLAYISRSVTVDEAARETLDSFAEDGKTPLLFAENDRLIGIIAVADTLKPDSREAVLGLKRMGVRTVMLTGDNQRTANAIAREVGIDDVIAGLLPDEKAQAVSELMKHSKTAMVGDGINDAPALISADVGIAIGAGTDIAIDSADVVLMNSKLGDVTAALKLSRATIRNIRENLFWAFIYNALCIPLAAGVFAPLFAWQLSPMTAAAAMSLSSFCVVLNALRLNLIKPHKKDKEKHAMTKTLKIEGMMCPHCEARVKKALELLPQVDSAEVSHELGTAVLTLNSEAEDSLLKQTVEAQGYTVV